VGRTYATASGPVTSVTTVLDRYFDIKPKDEAQAAGWKALAERGSRVHALIANPPATKAECDALPAEEQNGLFAAHRFMDEWGFKTEAVELRMVSEALGYGGTCDRVGRMASGRIILDWKTGVLRHEYIELQLGAYSGLYLAVYPRRKLGGAVGVQLDLKRGDYSVAPLAEVELQRWHEKFMRIKEEINL